MDYKGMIGEIEAVLRDYEESEHQISRHYLEGQILAIVQRYVKSSNPTVI